MFCHIFQLQLYVKFIKNFIEHSFKQKINCLLLFPLLYVIFRFTSALKRRLDRDFSTAVAKTFAKQSSTFVSPVHQTSTDACETNSSSNCHSLHGTELPTVLEDFLPDDEEDVHPPVNMRNSDITFIDCTASHISENSICSQLICLLPQEIRMHVSHLNLDSFLYCDSGCSLSRIWQHLLSSCYSCSTLQSLLLRLLKFNVCCGVSDSSNMATLADRLNIF